MGLPPPSREDAVWPPSMARLRNRRTCRAFGILPRRGTGLSRRHAESAETRVMRGSCGRRRRRRNGGAATLSAPGRSGGLFRNGRSIPVTYRTAVNGENRKMIEALLLMREREAYRTRNWFTCDEKSDERTIGKTAAAVLSGRYSTHACGYNRQGTVAAETGRSALDGRPGREIPSCNRTPAGQTRAETQTFPAAFRFECVFAPKRGLNLTPHRRGGRRHASRGPLGAFSQVRIATCLSAR